MQGGRESFTGPHMNHSLSGPGPAKKRKHNPAAQRHWDDPGQQSSALPYDEGEVDEPMAGNSAAAEEGEEEEEEESRELTHDEIWDDSALIDAWESATAEYEAYHGKGKGWKKDSVKKSPLWYNVPPDPSTLKTSVPDTHDTPLGGPDPENTRPLDFNTFVPSHDPALAQVSQPAFENYSLAPASGESVSRDEAFNRALGAMYWTGYWTAVYHSHQQNEGHAVAGESGADNFDGNDAGEEGVDEDEEMLVSTQR
ncbi:hypothetical protein BC834DRAFT_866017 [Gloeopeniophorella convolvens]|nr:hypothetical protein BC834DRAFT_866017 [Gloeopeniophorella convolvens]